MKTNDGLKGVVHSVSVLRQKVKVVVTNDKDEKEIKEYMLDELSFKTRRKKEHIQMDDELKALEELEKKEGKSKLG